MRDLASFHQLSATNFLLQVYDHVFDLPEEETTYWTMMDLSGQIRNLGSELKMLLSSPEFQGCKAESITIRGGLTQMLLHANEKALVIRIGSKGEVRSHDKYRTFSGARIVQNFKGDLR